MSKNIALLLFCLSFCVQAQTVFLSNETNSEGLSKTAAASIPEDYKRYIKEFPNEEKRRKKETEANGEKYAPAKPLPYGQFKNRNETLFKYALALRNERTFYHLTQLSWSIDPEEMFSGRRLSRDEILPPDLRTAIEAAFERNLFKPMYDNPDIARVLEKGRAGDNLPVAAPASSTAVVQTRGLPVSDKGKHMLEDIVRASLEAWDRDYDLYRIEVVERREIMSHFCKFNAVKADSIPHPNDFEGGSYDCSPEALGNPAFKGAMQGIEESAGQGRSKQELSFVPNKFLKTPFLLNSLDWKYLNVDLLTLTRFEANRPNHIITLDRLPFANRTIIWGYQVIVSMVIDDWLKHPAISPEVFLSFPKYNQWINENLSLFPNKDFNLESLSPQTLENLQEFMATLFTSFRTKTQDALRDSTAFYEPGGLERVFSPGKEENVARDPEHIEKTIIKFSDDFPILLNSRPFQKLLMNKYGLPDINDPKIEGEMRRMWSRRQAMVKSQENQRQVWLVGLSVGLGVVSAFVPVGYFRIVMGLDALIGATAALDYMIESRNHSNTLTAKFVSVSSDVFRITDEEVEEGIFVEQSALDNIVFLAVAVGVEIPISLKFRMMTQGRRVGAAGKVWLRNSTWGEVKTFHRTIEAIFERKVVSKQIVLEEIANRLRTKGLRFRNVFRDTLGESGLLGKFFRRNRELGKILELEGRPNSEKLAELEKMIAAKKATSPENIEFLESLPPTAKLVELRKLMELKDFIQLKRRLEAESKRLWLELDDLLNRLNKAKVYERSQLEHVFLVRCENYAQRLREHAILVEDAVHPYVARTSPELNLVRRANAKWNIENVDGAMNLLNRIIDKKDFDEHALMTLLNDGDRAARYLSQAEMVDPVLVDPALAGKEWRGFKNLRSGLREMRQATGEGTLQKWTTHVIKRTRLDEAENWLVARGVTHPKAYQFAKRIGQFLNMDYGWVEKVDGMIFDFWTNPKEISIGQTIRIPLGRGIWIPKGYTQFALVSLTVNELTALVMDRKMRGQPLIGGDDWDKTGINMVALGVESLLNPYLALGKIGWNFSIVRTVAGFGGVGLTAATLTVTGNLLFSHNLFDDECITQALRRIVTEEGVGIVIRTARKLPLTLFQRAVQNIAGIHGLLTGVAISGTNLVDTALGRVAWQKVGEDIFDASGACRPESRQFLDDIEIFTTKNPNDPRFLSALNAGFVRDISRMGEKEWAKENPRSMADILEKSPLLDPSNYAH